MAIINELQEVNKEDTPEAIFLYIENELINLTAITRVYPYYGDGITVDGYKGYSIVVNNNTAIYENAKEVDAALAYLVSQLNRVNKKIVKNKIIDKGLPDETFRIEDIPYVKEEE